MVSHLDGYADLVIVNGKVTTGLGDGDHQAVAVKTGRIALVGSDEEVRATVGPRTSVVDTRGARVVPGLIDSHIHVVRAGLTWTARLDWSATTSLADALDSIREMAGRVPEGTWIAVVGGWHPHWFREGRGPTVEELTRAAPHHPTYVQLLYEEALLNQRGIEACELEATTPDPPGGWFERDAAGAPTGRMRGPAAFGYCLRRMEEPSFGEQVESSRRFFHRLNSLGLTGTIDPGGMNMSPEAYRPLYELWRRGDLTLRMRLYVMPTGPGTELEQIRDYVKHLHPGFGDEMLKLVGLGEIPVFGCWDGEGVRPFEVSADAKALLREIVFMLARNGWPLHDHAVLDSTIGHVLDVWEEVDAEIPLAPLRFSLAHAEPIGEENLRRVQRLGAGIGVQARMLFRAADSAQLWGSEVLDRSPPLRSILDLGIPLGAGTDATAVTPYNPWLTLWWLVTGKSLDGAEPRRPDQRMTRAEALAAYTSGSAWFSFDERTRGLLAPGMAADLAVLTDDYFEIDEDDIPDLRSVLTLVGGKPVYVDRSLDADLGGDR